MMDEYKLESKYDEVQQIIANVKWLKNFALLGKMDVDTAEMLENEILNRLRKMELLSEIGAMACKHEKLISAYNNRR
jgi:hypothetical protein